MASAGTHHTHTHTRPGLRDEFCNSLESGEVCVYSSYVCVIFMCDLVEVILLVYEEIDGPLMWNAESVNRFFAVSSKNI